MTGDEVIVCVTHVLLLSCAVLLLLRALRFRLAMERYFMVSPDHSSKLTLLATNSTANDANDKEGK